MPWSILGGRSKRDRPDYPTPKDYAEAQMAKKQSPSPIEAMCPFALVRRHPEGGYSVVYGWIEESTTPEVDVETSSQYVTLRAAVDEARLEGYWSCHPEIYRPPAKLVKGL